MQRNREHRQSLPDAERPEASGKSQIHQALASLAEVLADIARASVAGHPDDDTGEKKHSDDDSSLRGTDGRKDLGGQSQ